MKSVARGLRLIVYRAMIPSAIVSAPGNAREITTGMNFPFTRLVFGCKESTNEGTAEISTSYKIMLFVVKKYWLLVVMHTTARISVSSVFMI